MIEKRSRPKLTADGEADLPPELLEQARQLAHELSPLLKALAKH